MVGKRGPLRDRFESKFARGGDDDCWPWGATLNNKGYGMVWDFERGRKVLAHRASYELHVGPIPEGLTLMHTCDNPACVNPAHLRVGSHRENMHDKIAKGRARYGHMPGSANGNAILTNEAVISLRRDYIAGMDLAGLAKKYGVSRKSLTDYTSGKSWQHLLDVPGVTLADLRAAKREKPGAKITAEVAAEIRRRLEAGETGRALAREFGIHFATVSDIKHRRIWG
jgi:hypothetical protein